MDDIVKRMMVLFKGLDRAYGLYSLDNNELIAKGQKVLGKPKTLQGEVNSHLWQNHLIGNSGIGIVPIMNNSKCFFGAIDIDIYSDFDYKKLITHIYNQALPVIPIRSKSGGLHLFMFLKEPVAAKTLIEKLRMIASYIGQSKAEIFPKQTEILAERGDIGQWINMPYYNYEYTERYAYTVNSEKMSIEEFIKKAEGMRLSQLDLLNYKLMLAENIDDGPPCLQTLITKGFTPGSRNDCMFNVGVYLKKAHADSYPQLVDDFNIKYCDPRLSLTEVQNIINSLQKRDYFYTCDRSPLKEFCNKQACKNKKYGIGSSLEMPNLTGLTKFNSNPPIWFIDVEDAGRLELNTDDIQSQSKFQRKCMECINQMPPPVKPAVWQSIISNLLENINIIEVPEHASPTGIFYEYLEKFCTSRAQARVRDEILLGKPFTEGGQHYFRLVDLIAFLERNHFKDFKINKITSMIQQIDGKHHFFKLKEKGVNVWSIPVFPTPVGDFETPDIKESTVI